jgi:acrylyl-CoA reductase (NADPH)
METFPAILVTRDEATKVQDVRLTAIGEDVLTDGNVSIAVEWSTINFKDGLAITGRSPVVRRFPMVPGVDMAGRVLTSADPRFKTGDPVLVNGFTHGEMLTGGYATRAHASADHIVPMPSGLDGRRAMAIGTAGYTAMLCVMALERHGLTPDRGPVVVTGSAGGVGSIAVALLAKLGWHVVAVTGRTSEEAWLKSLGAAEIVDRAELAGPVKPLAKERWAAAVDTVGSTPLANVISQIRYGGAVAACGLAAGMDLPATVAPFILRGVALLGVESVVTPVPIRVAAYERLVRDLDPAVLDAVTSEVGLEDVIALAPEILKGQVRGRTVVRLGG